MPARRRSATSDRSASCSARHAANFSITASEPEANRAEVERRLVWLVDGARDLATLTVEIAPGIGGRVLGAGRASDGIAAQVAASLEKLAAMGLLVLRH